MRNLLQETLKKLDEHGLTPDQVQWVGRTDGWFTWEEFAALADQEYESDWGVREIDAGLIVAGDGWWLERREYDGREWWAFCALPVTPAEHRQPETLGIGAKGTLRWQPEES